MGPDRLRRVVSQVRADGWGVAGPGRPSAGFGPGAAGNPKVAASWASYARPFCDLVF